MRWLIASTVITAMLQQVVDDDNACRFSLKGGTLLQHVFGLASRATKDIDGIVRGIGRILELMDEQFVSRNWGPFEFARSEIEQIRVPGKSICPRRFVVTVSLRNKTWRKIKWKCLLMKAWRVQPRSLSPRRRLRVLAYLLRKACRYGHVLSSGSKNSCGNRSS